MLKVEKFLFYFQRILIIIFLIIMTFMLYIKYKMSTLSIKLVSINSNIEELEEDKKILDIELTYLTSSERILQLIEKNPKILAEKNIIKYSQLKTKKEFIAISSNKLKNKIYNEKESKVAKND